jgi:hypothetical protein
MDRDETLRRAELLLRQGRPDAAAEEYARVAAANPGDLATANALGDLYLRLERPDLALPLYLRVADIYLREGFFAKAAASYRKVLKYQPESETALLKLAEACRAQGLRVEARGCLQAVLRARQRRNDPVEIDDALVRLADNEPSDLEAALAAAPSRARRQGVEAIASLRATVAALEAAGRGTDAEPVRRLIVILTPESDAGTDPAVSPPVPEEQAVSDATGYGGEAGAQPGLDAIFADLRRSDPIAPEPGASRLALAETYLAAGLDAEAVPLLEALAADPATVDRAALLMAGVCERRGRLADAARWMTAALDSGLPDAGARSMALQRLGDLHERLREPARALAAWTAARRLVAGSADLDERIARARGQGSGGGGSFTP